MEFGKSYDVVGFDIKASRIEALRRSDDKTLETSPAELAAAKKLRYSNDLNDLRDRDFFIVTVPTPVDQYNRPDLSPLYGASETVGKAMKRGAIVVYESTVYPSSMKVAEAAKVIENSQRDLNIAFVNELAKIFRLIGIDTNEVLEAAGTKWNFLRFKPGLVGGHCIGVDPYYLTHKAQSLGYLPEVILAGRRINDGMGKYVAEEVVKLMIRKGHKILNARVLQLGITFKENCPDIRNSRAVDVVHGLQEFGCKVDIFDPWADPEEVEKYYGLESTRQLPECRFDAVVLAVAHREFLSVRVPDLLQKEAVVFDIKGVLPANQADERL